MPPPLAPLLRNIPNVALVPHRSLIYLSGSHATDFLNGVIASSVPNPPRGPFYSCFLHAQGRVLYDIFVYTKKNPQGQDGYLIEYDSRPSEAPPLLPFLKRFILRSKVKIEDVSDQYKVWASWGSEVEKKWDTPRHWNWTRSGVAEPLWEEGDQWPWGNEECRARDRRAIGMGQRSIVRTGDKPPESTTHEIASADAYTLHRIMHGVPEGAVDIPAMQAFPMESNLDFMGGLDFRKGCYVGQELTVRTYHTGVVRKRILPVVVEADNSADHATEMNLPPSHSEIRAVVNQIKDAATPLPRPRGTGKLLSTCQNVGLALLRLEQVKAVEGGLLCFRIQNDEGNWLLRHWWPSSIPPLPGQG